MDETKQTPVPFEGNTIEYLQGVTQYKTPFPAKAPAWIELEIPAGTPEGTPMELNIDLAVAHISKIQVLIPPGHQGLARIQIQGPQARLIPGPVSNVQWLRGDSYVYDAPLDYDLDGPPFRITLRGWNADATYPHTFFVSIYP